MPRQSTNLPGIHKSPSQMQSHVAGTSDDLVVRAYLRIVIGSTPGSMDQKEKLELEFISSIGKWCNKKGVDRRTLSRFGISRQVLDSAKLKETPVSEIIRRYYGIEPFSVSMLAQCSAISLASVRKTINVDERDGLIEMCEVDGKTSFYRLVTQKC